VVSAVNWGTRMADIFMGDWKTNPLERISILILVAALASNMFWTETKHAKSSDFNQFRLALLNDSYVRSQERLCEQMLIDNNRDATNYASQKRADIQDDIKKLTGEYPPLPTCKELGVR